MEMSKEIQNLYGGIAELIKQSKTKVAVTVNSELALLYWKVGKSIHEFVLQGNRAAYGKEIIFKLSEMITSNFGKGWGEKQIRHCLQVAESFSETQIVSAVRRQLTWTHINNGLPINYIEPLKLQK